MKHYRLTIAAGKVTDCAIIIEIGNDYRCDAGSGVHYLLGSNGKITGIICESNSSTWAKKIATEFLEKI